MPKSKKIRRQGARQIQRTPGGAQYRTVAAPAAEPSSRRRLSSRQRKAQKARQKFQPRLGGIRKNLDDMKRRLDARLEQLYQQKAMLRANNQPVDEVTKQIARLREIKRKRAKYIKEQLNPIQRRVNRLESVGLVFGAGFGLKKRRQKKKIKRIKEELREYGEQAVLQEAAKALAPPPSFQPAVYMWKNGKFLNSVEMTRGQRGGIPLYIQRAITRLNENHPADQRLALVAPKPGTFEYSLKNSATGVELAKIDSNSGVIRFNEAYKAEAANAVYDILKIVGDEKKREATQRGAQEIPNPAFDIEKTAQDVMLGAKASAAARNPMIFPSEPTPDHTTTLEA